MRETVVVRSGEAEFFVEVESSAGPQTVGLDDAFSFDGVRSTLAAVAGEFQRVWDECRPSEASVEFGMKVTAKTGKLSGLIVDGGGEATFKVVLQWKSES